MVKKEDVKSSIKVTLVCASNVPGCVLGVVPAANVICGINHHNESTNSVVSYSPSWNHQMEFTGNSKFDNMLLMLRDADQLLGSLQVPLKTLSSGDLTTKAVTMVEKYKKTECYLTFTVFYDDRSSQRKKRLLMTTKKLKETVMSRFGSDPALNLCSSSDTTSFTSDVKSSTLSSYQSSNGVRSMQRCHSYVNEHSRTKTLSRHQYVNTGKHRSCGELGKNVDLTTLRNKQIRSKSDKKVLVVIEGRNLGTSVSDIISVNIGGTDCSDDIQYLSSQKLLVRVPYETTLSPVSVVTKSGGIGQQNTKVKVTYDTSCQNQDRRSLENAPRNSASTRRPPPFSVKSQLHISAGSCTSISGTSDSGSDNMCVNTRSRRSFVPPPRTRCSSLHTPSQRNRSTSSMSSRSFNEIQSSNLGHHHGSNLGHHQGSYLNTRTTRTSSSSSDISDDKPQETCPRPCPSVPGNDKKGAAPAIIPISEDDTDIIAPPECFSEGASPVPESRADYETLLTLDREDLIKEVLKLRNEVTDLNSTVDGLRLHLEKGSVDSMSPGTRDT